MPKTGGAFAGALAAGGALALAGCGSGGPPALSAADFDQRLNALCGSLQAFERGLPQVIESRQLSVTQAGALSKKEGTTFRANVTALVPPGPFQEADHALVSRLGAAPASPSESASSTTDTAWVSREEQYDQSLASDYAALEASGCATMERAAISSWQSLIAPH